MADGRNSADEECTVDEAASIYQSHLVSEDVQKQFVGVTDAGSSWHVAKSPSAQSSSDLYQGSYDWRKRLRSVGHSEHPGSFSGDRNPDDFRQRSATDVTNVSCVRYNVYVYWTIHRQTNS